MRIEVKIDCTVKGTLFVQVSSLPQLSQVESTTNEASPLATPDPDHGVSSLELVLQKVEQEVSGRDTFISHGPVVGLLKIHFLILHKRLPDALNYIHRADARLAPSQWETLLQSHTISHWLGTHLESVLIHIKSCVPCSSWISSHILSVECTKAAAPVQR